MPPDRSLQAIKLSLISATILEPGGKDSFWRYQNFHLSRNALIAIGMRCAKQNDFALGAVQFVAVSPEIVIANMIGQHGIRKTGGIPPIRYDAVETALETVGKKALEKNASVHLPRIGCGLAGGEWDKIEPLIENAYLR